MPVKRVHYDARSLEPSVGDKVEVIINRINSAEPEQVEVVYLGCVQLESFTTPYFKLLMPDNKVRLVVTNDVREFVFSIAAPEFDAPKLSPPHPNDYSDYSDYSKEGGY